jgi:hypothetical protein
MRQLMELPEETKVTKKYLRDSESAWQYYSAVLKQHVEEDVLDFPPPGEQPPPATSEVTSTPLETVADKEPPEPGNTSPARADAKHATPQQIARLKLLAQQVGDDAYADVQDLLDHHREGMALDVYALIRQRLQDRKTAQKPAASGDQRD